MALPARTERLLSAPILPTLARLAAPGAVLVAFQSAVSIGDTFFVGRLGTEPLAGLALVFPLLMLLQMTSAGAMGGGVSSAVARAIGAGNRALVNRLIVHATVIALVMGFGFTLLVIGAGPALYRLLGGSGEAIDEALAYSNVVFAGAALVWLANTFASVLRGTGNTLAPALALGVAACVHVPLSGALVLGGFGLPALGIAGAAVAYVTAFGLAAAAMLAFLLRSGGPLRASPVPLVLEWRVFAEILRVGALSSLSALQTVIATVILTGLVARYGTAALAGYGVGVRLELLQVPLVFAIGQAMVPMIGASAGAGRFERAKRIALVGATLAGCVSLAIGLAVTAAPQLWTGLFTADADVLAAGNLYLRTVGLFYPFFAVGIALYFASQGPGRVLGPVLAGTARLVLVAGGGFAVAAAGLPLVAVYTVIAAGMVLYGALTAWAVWRSRWERA